MSIYEYDEKKQRRFDREEGREEGRAEGISIGGDVKLIALIQKKVIKGKTLDAIADELESTEEEIKLVTCINGWNEESLDDIYYVRCGEHFKD